MGDQPFWARRAYELGVAPRPVPRRKLTVEHLRHALQQTVSDPAIRSRAAELGERIRPENGVAAAVEALTRTGER